jgi:hypothetical protein
MERGLDERSRELFAAARSERASSDARARALRAALAVGKPRGKVLSRWLAYAAVAASVAALAGLARHPVATAPIGRELVPAAVATVERQPIATTARSGEVPPLTMAPKPPVRRRPVEIPRATPTLTEELAVLERARVALESGSSDRALDELERYERTLHGTKLRAEATLLRIQALAAAGRRNDARALAERFVAENPGSPLVDRARSFMTPAEPIPPTERPSP